MPSPTRLSRTVVALVVAAAATAVPPLAAVPCTSDHLAVFKEATIAGPVNMCMSASEIKFTLPPTSELTETQRNQVCSERVCQEMIAAIDDMDVPRCDLLMNGRNVTLQMSLDRFAAICDAPRSVAPEVKKRGPLTTDSSATRLAGAASFVVGGVAAVAAWSVAVRASA